MSAEEDRRALQRFVAGLEVEADALATAITAQALDRAIVNQALLRNLDSDDAVVRRRTARRIARMIDVGDAVAGRLAIVAETDPDERTREAATAALEAHDRLPPERAEPQRRRPGLLAALRFKPALVRATGAFGYDPAEPPPGPRITSAELELVGGAVHLRFTELPSEFDGTLPVVVAFDETRGGTELARATAPVSPEGAVSIALPQGAGSLADISSWLGTFDLVVLEP